MKLTVPYPPSANRYWRHDRGIIHRSSEAKAYRKAITAIAISERLQPVAGRVRFTAYVYRPRKSGDLMNREKVLCDALQGVAYNDDSQIWEAHFFMGDDKANPRVEIEVEQLDTSLFVA